jgi:hypothetical protein
MYPFVQAHPESFIHLDSADIALGVQWESWDRVRLCMEPVRGAQRGLGKTQLRQLEDELFHLAIHARAAEREAALLEHADRRDVVTSHPRAQRARAVVF